MVKTALQVTLAAALMSSAALADGWTKTFAVPGKPELQVVAGDASVHVRAWDRQEIQARVTTTGAKIGTDAVRVIDHQTGNRVELEVRIPRTSFGLFGHGSVHIELQVPRELRSDIRTGDGGISIESIRGETHLYTGDGSIDVDSLDGTLDAKTGDGSVRVRGRFDLLSLSTGDGSIEASVNPGSKMNSMWTIRTGDGHVTLRLPSDFSAELNVRTGDGSIHSDLPVAVSGAHRNNELRGKLNAGGSLLTVQTGDGSVQLNRL